MQQTYSDDQLKLAARLYYVDGMGQAEVGRFVQVSQAKVSRLLAAARQRGIVRISVADYDPRDSELEAQLKKVFPLRHVMVVKTMSGGSPEDVRQSVGHFGAPFIEKLVQPGSTVAIAGGRTIRHVVLSLRQNSESRATVVQAMGSVDSQVSAVDAFELGRVLAKTWGGFLLTVNTPAFVPDKATRNAFLALPQIQSVWKRLHDADAALVGIGTPLNSVFADRSLFARQDLRDLEAAGAVGEICGRFFNSGGEECISPWRDRVISIGLETLRRVPTVVAIVAGADRALAVAAAIRGGLIKSLLIDTAGANALLARCATQ